jgi:hypothetical protein
MVISAGLRKICSELDKFQVATAVGHTSKDAVTLWNLSFAERLGLEESEMKKVELRNIIIPDGTIALEPPRSEDSLPPSPFTDCVIRIPGHERQILGRSVQREDGFILIILDHASGNRGIEEYARGYVIGQNEERQRSQQIVHDNVSGDLLAASFAAENVRQKLEDAGRPEAEDLRNVIHLIEKAITDLVTAFNSEPPNKVLSEPEPG